MGPPRVKVVHITTLHGSLILLGGLTPPLISHTAVRNLDVFIMTLSERERD